MAAATPGGGGITAVLLAGSRPGTDPIAARAGVAVKALAPVGGLPMIDRPARTLADHAGIARLIVLTQTPALFTQDPQTCWMASHPKVQFETSGAGIARSIGALIDRTDISLPLLVTTADHVLLSAAMIDQFLGEAQGADLAVAMVERRVLLASYPRSRRTWLKFRDGWWSGANLFWLGSDRARPLVDLWRGVEQDRKKGWRVVAAFGPLMLIGAGLRILSLRGGIARIGRRLGMEARLVAMDEAQACIDADKPEDIALIEDILAGR